MFGLDVAPVLDFAGFDGSVSFEIAFRIIPRRILLVNFDEEGNPRDQIRDPVSAVGTCRQPLGKDPHSSLCPLLDNDDLEKDLYPIFTRDDQLEKSSSMRDERSFNRNSSPTSQLSQSTTVEPTPTQSNDNFNRNESMLGF